MTNRKNRKQKRLSDLGNPQVKVSQPLRFAICDSSVLDPISDPLSVAREEIKAASESATLEHPPSRNEIFSDNMGREIFYSHNAQFMKFWEEFQARLDDTNRGLAEPKKTIDTRTS